MSLNEDYRDFLCYEITDTSEKAEIDVDLDKVEELFSSEGVYLFVRYDIRRIFIWKGPKSPVRKRFISSRIASKLQEESSQVGMHLKIVSVDAGDEPVEFLNAFNVESYEVSDDEKPEDMYYIRNEERRKLQEAELAAKKEQNGDENEEYWSPVLEEQKRLEQMQEAKKKAVSTTQEIASSIGKSKKKTKPSKKSASRTPTKSYSKTTSTYSRRHSFGTPSSHSKTAEEEKELLDRILKEEVPENKKRLNIIIGTSLWGPKRMISSLFGKEVEEVNWDKVSTIPEGKIEIKTTQIRVYCKDNQIEGVEILGDLDQTGKKPEDKENPNPMPEFEEKETKEKPKRELKEIPKGE